MFTPSDDPHPESRRPGGHDDPYATKPPWDIDHPQAAFATLAESGQLRGRVLDIGCGTGEHALLAAGLGLDATGIDQSAQALDQARHKASERGLTARFLRHDALELAELGQHFDTVLDCGLFHIFDGDTRTAYVRSLAHVLDPGGRYFMLGFSDRQPGDWGPHRLSEKDIQTAFADGWHIDTLEPTQLEILIAPNSVAAWFTAITRQ